MGESDLNLHEHVDLIVLIPAVFIKVRRVFIAIQLPIEKRC